MTRVVEKVSANGRIAALPDLPVATASSSALLINEREILITIGIVVRVYLASKMHC